MADEPLIMRAGISYDPTPLNQLKKQLDGLKSSSAVAIRKDFEEVRGSVSKAAAEIRNSLTPAMAAMGIGSLGVGAAITGVVAAVRSLTSGLTEMRMASKETGATVQELRELQALGRRFDINPDAMSGGVMAFSDTMRQIKNKWGETYEWMRTASPEMAELGKKLFNAKNMDEALEAAMSGISGIENPKVRQMLAEKLFGSRLFSQLGSEGAKSFEEIRAEIHKRIAALPPDADRVAREFKESMDQIGDAAVNLQTQFAKALLPVLPEIKAGIDEFTTFLRAEKGEISKFFTEVVTDARTFVHDLRGHFDSLRAGYEAAKEFFGGSKTGGATHGALPEASIGETVSNPEIASRRLQMDELRRQHAILEERIARKESEPDPMGGEGHAVAAEERRRLDKLNGELKRLSDEIQALRQNSATVQQQSFNGGSGFGGMIQNASFGGGGLGGRRYSGGGSGSVGEGGGSYGLNREDVGRAGRAAREGATGSPDGQIAPFKPGSFDAKAPQVMRRLMQDFGIGREDAGVILGNLGHESEGFKAYQEKNPLRGRGGAGWAQWTGKRRVAFEAWAAEHGLDPRSDEANYGFLRHELGGTYKGALEALRQAAPGDKMRIFEKLYEGADPRFKGFPSRERYRNRALRAYDQTPRENDTAPSGNSLEGRAYPRNWFGKTMSALNGTSRVEGDARLSIDLNGFPKGTRARTSMSGLFKELELTRGKSMQPSEAI